MLLVLAGLVGACESRVTLWVASESSSAHVVRVTGRGHQATYLVGPHEGAYVFRGPMGEITVDLLTADCQLQQTYSYEITADDVLTLGDDSFGLATGRGFSGPALADQPAPPAPEACP